MHEEQDAALWASWGVGEWRAGHLRPLFRHFISIGLTDTHTLSNPLTTADYLKEDSCGGTTHGTMWEQYVRMRDGLNKTGRPIYFSITQAQDWDDGHARMHCYGSGAFSTLFWTTANPPLDPRTLANSYLVEYCNNMDMFGDTDGYPNGPGGFLSNLDSQQLLTWDNMSMPGSFNDNDMLEVCHGTAQTYEEYSAQFSTWAILASPLILGNDIRSMTDDCKSIILNKEVIAVNQDPLGIRGRLAIQWPLAVWPSVDPPAASSAVSTSAPSTSPLLRGAPTPTGTLTLLPCNTTSPAQLFTFTPTGFLQSQATGDCLTYGGYRESNLAPTACTGWSVPGIGSQLWAPNASTGALHVVGNLEKVMDVLDCNVTSTPTPVQVCTGGGSDCFSNPTSPPPGCGPTTGQAWDFSFSTTSPSATSAPSTLESRVGGGGFCVAVAPPHPNPIDIRLQVWVKPLVDGSVAFLAFNRHTQPILANVTWGILGWGDSQKLALRNIVNHTDLGVFTGPTFSFQVLPHTHVFIKAVPQA